VFEKEFIVCNMVNINITDGHLPKLLLLDSDAPYQFAALHWFFWLMEYRRLQHMIITGLEVRRPGSILKKLDSGSSLE
jgi:hypothetical protein